jgi:alanine dehydrogenase
MVQAGAGAGSGFGDEDYQQAGATLMDDAATAWAQEMVVKVKEPQPSEYAFFRPNLILFTYLHLAAERSLTEALMQSGIEAIAYETVVAADGRLPLLTPMSIIAGRLSVQFGARYLERQQGGRGVLLGGNSWRYSRYSGHLGRRRSRYRGGQNGRGSGSQSANYRSQRRSPGLPRNPLWSRVELLYSSPAQIAASVPQADLLIGAVLVPGRKAPTLVSKNWCPPCAPVRSLLT